MAEKFTLGFVSRATKAEIKSSPRSGFSRVETDSRKDLSGALFVALKGERFDAHDFVSQAVAAGAHGVLIHEWREDYEALKEKADFLLVPDTLKALQELARAWRRQCDFIVVGITGSNGKTTTKELAHQILKNFCSTSASPGSFNNHWGVPLSLLMAEASDKVVLQEMGMNHAGEITQLCHIAEPDIVVVTTVGSAHIGELGSVEAIKKAKGEIYRATPQGFHIFNIDNEHTLSLYEEDKKAGFPKERLLTFSAFNPEAQVYLRSGSLTAEGMEVSGRLKQTSGKSVLKAFGRQTVVNLMAASGIALALKMEPQKIFENYAKIRFSTWGRNQWLHPQGGPAIIFDGYNANPDSMKMLLKNLYELEVTGEKIFVFGDMRELGELSESAHGAVAEFAGQIGLSKIWYMGAYGSAVQKALRKSEYQGELTLSEDFDAATAARFYRNLKPSDVVALKASRGSRIERVLQSWGVDGF